MKSSLPNPEAKEFESFLKAIGASLKARRDSLNLNQTDVDLAPLPLDVRKYQRMEYGEENFTMQSLFIVCRNLKISPKDLLDIPFNIKDSRAAKK